MKIKVCNNCGENKLVKEFPMSGNSYMSYPRNVCKKCYCEIVYNKYTEKMIRLYPDKYIDCDNCDRIYAKSRYKCPKCGEKNPCKS